MEIFKVGGASKNTAKAAKNIIAIVCDDAGDPLIVIVSSMGNARNNLEKILTKKSMGPIGSNDIKDLEKYHLGILISQLIGSAILVVIAVTPFSLTKQP